MQNAASTRTTMGYVAGLFLSLTIGLGAETDSDTQKQLLELRQQNDLLLQQVRKQQEQIDNLSHKVSGLEVSHQKQAGDIPSPVDESPSSKTSLPFNFGKVRLSGEGGVAFYNSQSRGGYPNAEFRVDELKLFVEAPIWEEVYFFSEINVFTHESSSVNLNAGELYLDFENVSRLWGKDRQLNLRVGRFYTPFGEEYAARFAIENPLVSHSLSDLWGVDEGLELYGSIGKVRYALAVQNGGIADTRDFTSDKSIAARLGWSPAKWLDLSVSAMRTGDLDSPVEHLSAMWFGNGFFRAIGANATTFHDNLVEWDVHLRLPRGHLKAAGGYIHQNDNAPVNNGRRDVYYYSIEAVHNLAKHLYAAARWSQILAPDGFPIVGNGDFMQYEFSNNQLTSNLWRLSLGLGYRWSPNLLLKVEYTLEQGRLATGDSRLHEDLLAAQVAFRF